MQSPLVLRFLVRFMDDADFRFAVLHREKETMDDFGLTEDQRDALRRLDSTEIKNMLQDAVLDQHVDLDEAKRIVWDGGECYDIFPTSAPVSTNVPIQKSAKAEAVYEEGYIHIRCVDLDSVENGVVSVWLRAHGLALDVKFQFRRQDNDSDRRPGRVIAGPMASDDLFQRVCVEATLPSGTSWKIYARNPQEAGTFEDQTKGVKTLVVP